MDPVEDCPLDQLNRACDLERTRHRLKREMLGFRLKFHEYIYDKNTNINLRFRVWLNIKERTVDEMEIEVLCLLLGYKFDKKELLKKFLLKKNCKE